MLPPFLIISLLFTFGSFGTAVDLDIDIEGNVYVVDSEQNMLLKFSSGGDSLDGFGGYGRGAEGFDEPVAVYARRGMEVYVADYNNHRIQRFDRRLDLISTLYTRNDVDEQARFGYPLDVVVSRQGEVLVLDGENRRVAVYDLAGRFLRSFGGPGDGEGRMTDPTAVELDNEDNVYVLDDGAIKLYDPFGGWVGHVSTPSDLPVLSFSIERDTMELLDSSTLWFYDMVTRQFIESSRREDAPVSGQMRRRDGRLYEVLPDRIRVSSVISEEDAEALQE